MDPPNKDLCAKFVIAALKTFATPYKQSHPSTYKAMKKTAKRIEKLPPNKNFLLCLLFNLEPRHEVFEKAYKKPKKARMNIYEEMQIVDDSNFFDGLPEAKKVKRQTLPGVTKQMKQR